MQKNNRANPFEKKQIARQKYAERQIGKFVRWSWEQKGKIKYKDIKKLQTELNIECYATRR